MDNPHRETLPQFHERAEQAVPPVRSGEAAHTPGPWRVRSRFVGPLEIVRDLSPADFALEPIALVGADTFAQCAANAELIAAAPDMLDSLDPDTLEAIADEIDCFEHSARAGSLRGIAKRQRAAISKATGAAS